MTATEESAIQAFLEESGALESAGGGPYEEEAMKTLLAAITLTLALGACVPVNISLLLGGNAPVTIPVITDPALFGPCALCSGP